MLHAFWSLAKTPPFFPLPAANLHLCSFRWGHFGVINLDLPRRHLVQTLFNDSKGLAHLLHTTQVPEMGTQGSKHEWDGSPLGDLKLFRKWSSVSPGTASLLGVLPI